MKSPFFSLIALSCICPTLIQAAPLTQEEKIRLTDDPYNEVAEGMAWKETADNMRKIIASMSKIDSIDKADQFLKQAWMAPTIDFCTDYDSWMTRSLAQRSRFSLDDWVIITQINALIEDDYYGSPAIAEW